MCSSQPKLWYFPDVFVLRLSESTSLLYVEIQACSLKKLQLQHITCFCKRRFTAFLAHRSGVRMLWTSTWSRSLVCFCDQPLFALFAAPAPWTGEGQDRWGESQRVWGIFWLPGSIHTWSQKGLWRFVETDLPWCLYTYKQKKGFGQIRQTLIAYHEPIQMPDDIRHGGMTPDTASKALTCQSWVPTWRRTSLSVGEKGKRCHYRWSWMEYDGACRSLSDCHNFINTHHAQKAWRDEAHLESSMTH